MEGHQSGADKVSALILAGGDGRRMGGISKAFLEVGGLTLLERAVRQASRFSEQVLVGLPDAEVDRGRSLVGSDADVWSGGATRQGTFEALLPRARFESILIHDVARPLGSDSLFKRVLSEARKSGAAAPCVAVTARDSLALREGDRLAASVDRDRLVAIQTPYAFSKDILLAAVDHAGTLGMTETTVTALVTAIGQPISLVEGEDSNLKVTYPEDWEIVKISLG